MDWAAAPSLCSSINPLWYSWALCWALRHRREPEEVLLYPSIPYRCDPTHQLNPTAKLCTHYISPSLWCPGGASCALGMGLRMGSRAVAWSQASLWVQRAVGTGEERRFWRSRWGGRYPAKRQGKLKAGAIDVLFSLFPFLFPSFGSLCS